MKCFSTWFHNIYVIKINNTTHPIPNNVAKGLPVPLSYCGISVLFRVYEGHSSILNRRPVAYAENLNI